MARRHCNLQCAVLHIASGLLRHERRFRLLGGGFLLWHTECIYIAVELPGVTGSDGPTAGAMTCGRNWEITAMLDVLLVLLTAGVFALCWGYIRGCDFV